MHVLDTRPGQACSRAFEVLGTIPADVHIGNGSYL
jgi:hypothetical protein